MFHQFVILNQNNWIQLLYQKIHLKCFKLGILIAETLFHLSQISCFNRNMICKLISFEILFGVDIVLKKINKKFKFPKSIMLSLITYYKWNLILKYCWKYMSYIIFFLVLFRNSTRFHLNKKILYHLSYKNFNQIENVNHSCKPREFW